MPASRRHFIKSTSALFASSLLPVAYFGKAKSHITTSDLALDYELKQRAKYTLIFASPYHTADAPFVPHMHLQFKNYVQTFSQGQIYVDIKDQGKVGVGTELMAAVSRGQVDAALVSVANLSRALPVLDILNIPFWVGDNQAFLNLISSQYWHRHVIEKIEKQGKLAILHHYITGARTLSTVKHANIVIKQPSDLKNMILRVPASNVLKHFYAMTDAHVVEVNWANVASMARSNKFQVLDPGIIGLYAGPDNLREEIATITQLNTVPDTWVNVISQQWLRMLPPSLRLAVNDAAQKTFTSHLTTIHTATLNCEQAFLKRDCIIYKPEQHIIDVWQDQFGHHRHEWRDIKKALLGSSSAFFQLLEASQTPSKYTLA